MHINALHSSSSIARIFRQARPPGGALRRVHQHDALGGKLLAHGIRGGKVLRLARSRPGTNSLHHLQNARGSSRTHSSRHCVCPYPWRPHTTRTKHGCSVVPHLLLTQLGAGQCQPPELLQCSQRAGCSQAQQLQRHQQALLVGRQQRQPVGERGCWVTRRAAQTNISRHAGTTSGALHAQGLTGCARAEASEVLLTNSCTQPVPGCGTRPMPTQLAGSFPTEAGPLSPGGGVLWAQPRDC